MLDSKVALVTGGANGIGAGVASWLAAQQVKVVVADRDEDSGSAVAKAVDGAFVRCDVGQPDDLAAAVAVAVERFGGLDIVHLNAGVGDGGGLGGPDFSVAAYRRIQAVNVDGVVFGVHAALPALRARGGGVIVATASMAGLVPMDSDPIYSATKHAVVGLVRSLAAQLAPEGIRVQALCPSYADTALLDPYRPDLVAAGFPLLTVDDVVDGFRLALASEGTGECWFVIPGRESQPFTFHRAPGPR